MTRARISVIAIACGILLLGDATASLVPGRIHVGGFHMGGLFLGEAQARLGRPATPRSVGGVARRTTRRVVRRSTIYIAALPAGCVVTPINGVNYWRCGGAYYQSSGNRYVVVYVD